MAQEEPTNYQFAGAGTGIAYIQDHAYAYSGQINLASTEKTLLSFTSNSSIFVGRFQMLYDWTGFSAGEQLGYTIKLNDITIVRTLIPKSTSEIDSIMRQVPIVIPPLTIVEILGDTDAGNIYVPGVLTGRVYGTD